MLQRQRPGGQVADFGGAVVLDGAREGVARLDGPLLAVGGEVLELFIIFVIGIPPATHSSAGREMLETFER